MSLAIFFIVVCSWRMCRNKYLWLIWGFFTAFFCVPHIYISPSREFISVCGCLMFSWCGWGDLRAGWCLQEEIISSSSQGNSLFLRVLCWESWGTSFVPTFWLN